MAVTRSMSNANGRKDEQGSIEKDENGNEIIKSKEAEEHQAVPKRRRNVTVDDDRKRRSRSPERSEEDIRITLEQIREKSKQEQSKK